MVKEFKDVQNQSDDRGIDISEVGIEGYETQIKIKTLGSNQQLTNAVADFAVSLPAGFKGTHMSRFIELLNTNWSTDFLNRDIEKLLKKTCDKLESKGAFLRLRFSYFMVKVAPISKLKAKMKYDCEFRGMLQDNNYKFTMRIKVPITTVCPCSKALSDRGAHNQRGILDVEIIPEESKVIWIEDIIRSLEEQGSCPVYPLLKREDEKFVTEKAYDNPKFVEDVIRDTVIALRKYHLIKSFKIKCTTQESIHDHEAFACWYSKKEKNKST